MEVLLIDVKRPHRRLRLAPMAVCRPAGQHYAASRVAIPILDTWIVTLHHDGAAIPADETACRLAIDVPARQTDITTQAPRTRAQAREGRKFRTFSHLAQLLLPTV
ncbi:MAG: hypothetical protein M0R28_07690 [Pigmentiphaga sp.]|nr:hypothetical protein [Pigmentiphaga sp.]